MSALTILEKCLFRVNRSLHSTSLFLERTELLEIPTVIKNAIQNAKLCLWRKVVLEKIVLSELKGTFLISGTDGSSSNLKTVNKRFVPEVIISHHPMFFFRAGRENSLGAPEKSLLSKKKEFSPNNPCILHKNLVPSL